MGVFNFMETFFFISLGITFVLILLLVYHFKQRLGTIEQKGDTMFEIVNTMVREMSLIKSMVISQMREGPVYVPVNSSAINEVITSETPSAEFIQRPNTLDNTELNESKDVDESDDSYDSDDSDDDDSDDEDKVLVSDDEDESAEKPLIKVINIPLSETVNSITEDTIEVIETEETEETDETEDEVSESVTDPNADSDVEQVTLEEEEPVLIVNKVSEPVPTEPDEVNVLEETKEPEEVNYNKMSLYNLKNLVVSRGLVSDSSKMKKPQLIQLLESSDK